MQSTKLTPSITAPGKLAVSSFKSKAQSPTRSASALPLGGVARSAENRDDYDSLSFDREVDGVGKSASQRAANA
jgi:hypothetical protein